MCMLLVQVSDSLCVFYMYILCAGCVAIFLPIAFFNNNVSYFYVSVCQVI